MLAVKQDASLVFCSLLFDSTAADLLTPFHFKGLNPPQISTPSLLMLNLLWPGWVGWGWGEGGGRRLDGESAALWSGGGGIRYLRVDTNAEDCQLRKMEYKNGTRAKFSPLNFS